MTMQKNQKTFKFQCKAQTLTGTWTHRNTDNIMFTNVTYFRNRIPVFALSANPIRRVKFRILMTALVWDEMPYSLLQKYQRLTEFHGLQHRLPSQGC